MKRNYDLERNVARQVLIVVVNAMLLLAFIKCGNKANALMSTLAVALVIISIV